MSSSNFPTALDTFTDPASTSKCNGSNTTGPVVTHAAMHALENDAIAALETKVGITSSTDPNSLDYKVAAAIASILALQGTSLLYGSGSPTSGTGVDGNFYLDDAAHVLYGPKAAGAWPAGISLIGPSGPQGAQGVAGAQGAAGSQGPQGTAGPQGAIGSQGPQGAAGTGGSSSGSNMIYFA